MAVGCACISCPCDFSLQEGSSDSSVYGCASVFISVCKAVAHVRLWIIRQQILTLFPSHCEWPVLPTPLMWAWLCDWL